MLRSLGTFLLAGVLIGSAVLAGCASRADLSLERLAQREGFSLSGRSERPLHSILMVLRELESENRPH